MNDVELQDEHLVVVVRRSILDAANARGVERVTLLRTQALAALATAARAMGAELGTLKKDERDAPLPSGGWHWSLSHTSFGDLGLAAACVSRAPVGVDAEPIRLPRPEIVASALSAAERRLFRGSDDALAFTRAWTAKEAVLKKLGLGLTALSETRIEDVDGDSIVLERDGTRHAVESRAFQPFLVAISGRAREGVDWRGDGEGEVAREA
ncbi:MAG TPA: 4'-phosphopantetheinyl transferase superfamily protein [Planctomycetota bacterium]|nr:4'-phosphopantetheinyl transferase superfamily protein [Planctomycetota bacterium]